MLLPPWHDPKQKFVASQVQVQVQLQMQVQAQVQAQVQVRRKPWQPEAARWHLHRREQGSHCRRWWWHRHCYPRCPWVETQGQRHTGRGPAGQGVGP